MAVKQPICFLNYPEAKTHLLAWGERPNPILLHMGSEDCTITVNGQPVSFPADAE